MASADGSIMSALAVDLKETNPELFQASPRPGGFLKVLVPPRSREMILSSTYAEDDDDNDDGGKDAGSKKCCCTCQEDCCHSSLKEEMEMERSFRKKHLDISGLPEPTRLGTSREFRITNAIQETDWAVLGIDETKTYVHVSNPMQNSLNTLAVTISTVMMMAAGTPNIPEDFYKWSERYLKCIVEDEKRPPNVQGILNHIEWVRQGGQMPRSSEVSHRSGGSQRPASPHKAGSVSAQGTPKVGSPPRSPGATTPAGGGSVSRGSTQNGSAARA